MSAVRNSANRAEARKKRALPYGRTIVKSVLRMLGYGNDEDEPELPEDARIPLNQPPTDRTTLSHSSRPQEQAFRPTSNQSTFGHRPPLAQVDYSNFLPRRAMDPPSSSLVPDTRSVADYFTQQTGTPIDTKVVESMVSTLQTSPEKKTFKFEFATTQSTPNLTPNATPTATPPSSKRLSRNPNGTYRWEGAGSAKHARPRNRYASPAFGASPSKPERLIMKESSATGEADHKRRRVVETDASISRSTAPEPSVPFPLTASPTTPRVAVTPPPRPTTVSASSRLRTPAKPTAPVVPSPLRQAWSGASPNSSREEAKRSPQPPKQTKTANYMAELIKETTPPKKPDLSNPYQSASPVGKVGPPKRGARRTRATGRPAIPTKEVQAEEEIKRKEKEKLDEVSPQAIIEATLPKGSKRSRPPAHFEKKPVEIIESIPNNTYTVEEPEDDGSSRSTKRSKPTLNGNGRPSTFDKAFTPPPEIRIEEMDEVQESEKDQEKSWVNGTETTKTVNGNNNVSIFAAVTAATNGSSSRASFSALKSIPREPSKLRFSFQPPSTPASTPAPALAPLPEVTTVTSSTSAIQPTPAAAPTHVTPAKSFVPPSSTFDFTFKSSEKEDAKTPEKVSESVNVVQETKPLTTEEIKAQVSSMDASSLPTFSFTFDGPSALPSSPDHMRARSDVKVLPPVTLPTFDFIKSAVDSSSGFKFELTPTKSSPTSYDTPKPSSHQNATPVKGFDFAAAGMKFEPKKDVWTCSICALTNNNSAAQCVACENPAPSNVTDAAPSKPVEAPKPAAPAVKAFDFAAAGLKMPTAKDTWTCSECFLSNPASAAKCETCEADRK